MGEYFRFRVQLVGVRPAVFRRFLLTTRSTFHELHSAIQVACGWEDAHLFGFRESARGAVLAGSPGERVFGTSPPDAKKVRLASCFSLEGTRACHYLYDFGDGWLHTVKLQTVEHHDRKWTRRLVDGARAFPPEDCGGLWGYEECIAAVTSGTGDAERREWLGDWEPEHFDERETRRRFDR